MTREEALEKIKKSMECHDRKVCGLAETCEECPLYVDKDTEYEAHKVLIKALSQEPCDNAIDREYLFKVLDDFCGHDRTATITLDTLADLVYDMPTVTQKPIECDDAISRAYIEPIIEELENICVNADEYILNLLADIKNAPPVTQKSGKWIKVTNGRGGHECDICHNYAPSYQDGDEYLTKFCPNCGAYMVEPQESEDKE